MSKKYNVVLSLGAVPVMIESTSHLFIDLVKYSFRGFLAVKNKYQIKVTVLIDDTKDTNTYSYGRPHHTSVVSFGGKFFSRASSYSGVFDMNLFTAEVSQSLAIGPLYLFLRFIMSVYLPMADGFLAHCASILRGNKSFLFLGKPQSGKSTVSKLSSSSSYHIISDDFSIIRKIKGRFFCFGSPFWGHVEVKGGNFVNHDYGFPVESTYFLRHDKKVYTEKLSKIDALGELISNIAILSKDQSVNAKIIQISEEFVRQVPCYYLYFKPDNTFWRCIENDGHVCIAK